MALGWAIIGAGMHPHQKLAPAIGLTPDAELIAVLSRDQGRADAFAETHGAKAGYSNIDDLLADSRIDAVFVASPNASHVGHTVQTAKAGKHVLSEKPMATSVDDALTMVQVCQASGVKLGLGFALRFHPAHLLARDLVSKGKLGRVRLLQGHWGRGERGEPEHKPRSGLRGWWEDPEAMGGGSVIMGLGVHVFDLVRFVMDQEILEVTAMTDGQTDGQPLEHIASMSLRLDDGTIANVSCGRMLPEQLHHLRHRWPVYGHRHRLGGPDGLGGGGQRNGQPDRELRVRLPGQFRGRVDRLSFRTESRPGTSRHRPRRSTVNRGQLSGDPVGEVWPDGQD